MAVGCSSDDAITAGDDGCDGDLHYYACESSCSYCSNVMSGCYSFYLGWSSDYSKQMDCTVPHCLMLDSHRSSSAVMDYSASENHMMIDSLSVGSCFYQCANC